MKSKILPWNLSRLQVLKMMGKGKQNAASLVLHDSPALNLLSSIASLSYILSLEKEREKISVS